MSSPESPRAQGDPPPSVLRLDGWVRDRLLLIEPALERHLPRPERWPLRLHESMRYALGTGGKRMRPLLAMAAFEAVGGHRDRPFGAVLPAACAVELLHTYSLVHDDLPAMDNSHTRRGQPSTHIAYGEALGILAGDALLTEAFAVVLDPSGYEGGVDPALCARLGLLLARAAGAAGMVGGQSSDMGFEGPVDTLATLTFLHRRKTGDLFRFAVEAGARVGGAEGDSLRDLQRYAEAFGLAFQIQDDVLDATQDEDRGGRSEAETPSFVHFVGVDGARAKALETLDAAWDAVASFGEDADPLRALAWRAVHRTL